MSIGTRRIHGVFVGSSLLLFAPSLVAQSWNLDLQVGRMRAALDPAGPLTEHGVLGLRFERSSTAVRLSTGAPVAGVRPLWGSVAAWQRLALRHKGLLAGFDLIGTGLLQQDSKPGVGVPGLLDPGEETPAPPGGHAVAGQLLPLIGFQSERVRLTARAGVSYYHSTLGGESKHRTVGLGDVQLWLQPVRAIALVPSIRHFRAMGERSTYAELTVALTGAALGAWGGLGEWLTAPTGTPLSWTAGASWKAHRLITLSARVRRDSFDPLYLAPSETSWNAGLSIPLSSPPRVRAPVPDRYRKGLATIHLPAAAAPQVERLAIAGDFNGWKPAPMERSGASWVYTVALNPGIYHYAFVDSAGKWFVPESVPGRRDDGMGGHLAVLVVEPER